MKAFKLQVISSAKLKIGRIYITIKLRYRKTSKIINLCQSLFFNKVAGPACNFKKEALTQVFPC